MIRDGQGSVRELWFASMGLFRIAARYEYDAVGNVTRVQAFDIRKRGRYRKRVSLII